MAEEPRRLRADAVRNREAIVAAARAAFERGETDRRFDDFASLAGVGVGTLYRHFPTRDALAAAVYDDEVAALCQHARQLLGALPPGEALATFLRDFVHRLTARPAFARTLGTLMQHQTQQQADGGRVLEEAVAELTDAAVGSGGLAGELTPGVVMTALHGIGSSYGRAGWQDDAEALVAVLVRPAPHSPTPGR